MASSEPQPALAPRRIGAGAGTPRCTVGLLTWNAGEELAATLDSLLKQTEPAFDFLWLDNASREVYTKIEQQYPQFGVAAHNTKNTGFCGGHNQLVAACRTPFYLALNQDAALDVDYIATLCDWLERDASLGMVTGLIIQADRVPPRLDSAGLVWTRIRHPFDLGHAKPVPAHPPVFRHASGVVGAALMLRLEACRAVSFPEHEIFAADFFAYHEELDLAQRLGRIGMLCGVAGGTRVQHVGGSSGGRKHPKIQAKIFANHWMLTLRHDSLGTIVREFPWLVYGEVRWWLKRYKVAPRALWWALGEFVRRAGRARRFYRAFEARHGDTRENLRRFRARAREEIRNPEIWRGPA